MGRMSDREKREREKIRAELKARGIIQPDKELIDRDLYSFGLYLFWALGRCEFKVQEIYEAVKDIYDA